MDVATIAKDYVLLQKRSLKNIFDTMALLHDCAEHSGNYWANRLGVSGWVSDAAAQWAMAIKQSRQNSQQFVNDGLTGMEAYFAGVMPQPPAE
jgi:hypothetical protein